MGRFEMRDQGRDCLIFCDVNFQGKCFNPHLLEAEMYRATKCVGGGGEVAKWSSCWKSIQCHNQLVHLPEIMSTKSQHVLPPGSHHTNYLSNCKLSPVSHTYTV